MADIKSRKPRGSDAYLNFNENTGKPFIKWYRGGKGGWKTFTPGDGDKFDTLDTNNHIYP